MSRVPTIVEIDDVQGNVLRPYAPGAAGYLRLTISREDGARELIDRWRSRVTFGRPKRGVHINLAFTYSGLERLGIPASLLDTFPEDFRSGAEARAAGIGDLWPTRSTGFKPSDVLVIVHATAGSGGHPETDLDEGNRLEACRRRDEAIDAIRSEIRDCFDCAGYRDAVSRRHEREPFGFSDGRSQPAIEGVDRDPVGDGVYADVNGSGVSRRRLHQALEELGLKRPARRWRLVRTGEFLLGYENEDGRLPIGPPTPVGPNGTFMVYREMPQHKQVFDDYVVEQASAHGIRPELLRAKIVGRWEDGTPLALSRASDPAIADNRRRSNDFRYEQDAHGYRCPHASHVRRSNPRDALPGGQERTMRHRIIRRGMPYYDEATGEEGLVFICLSASIEQGFEFIQREWIADGDTLGLGPRCPDFLLAPARSRTRMLIGGPRNAVLNPPHRPFVTVRGCEYLFVPSRRL